MANYLRRTIHWYLSPKAAAPYHAEVDGDMLVVRVNALTRYPNTSRYTLLKNASPVADFDDWPEAWGAPPEPAAPRDWPKLLQSPPADLCFIHDDGSENAPDDPIGKVRLVLRADGSVFLENRKIGRVRQWHATAEPAALSRVLALLRQVGFPNLPLPQQLVPGMPLRSVRILASQQCSGAVLSRDRTAPGSPERAFCDLIDVLIAQASDNQLYAHHQGALPRLISATQGPP